MSEEQKKDEKAEGVVVGVTGDREWLLPWWWMNYRLHNRYPVAFVDFGDMSAEALLWCYQRGNVIKLNLSDDFVSKREGVAPETARKWESIRESIWINRIEWFKKPFAMLQSPYQRTIWVDIDCQVRGSIQRLFEVSLHAGGIALAPEDACSQKIMFEHSLIQPGEILYNTGVVVFERDSPIMQEWAKESTDQNHLFLGDRQLLTHILFSKEMPFTRLPPIYNWQVDLSSSLFDKAAILNWAGAVKQTLEEHVYQLKEDFFVNLSWTDPDEEEVLSE